MLENLLVENYDRLRLIKRNQAKNVVAFVNVMHKLRYNKMHKNMKLKIEDYAFLRLHAKYIISRLINKKLSQQRVNLFKTLKKIDYFAYRLELSSIVRIHSIISIAQLKFALSFANDLYHRHQDRDSSSMKKIIFDEYEDFDYKSSRSYEIERLLEKRFNRFKMKYLVKWKNYDSKHNV